MCFFTFPAADISSYDGKVDVERKLSNASVAISSSSRACALAAQLMVACVCLLLAPSALGQGGQVQSAEGVGGREELREAARARLIEAGSTRMRARDFHAAYDLYSRAHAIRPDWESANNAGHAACSIGKPAEGAELLGQAVRQLPTSFSDYAELRTKFLGRKAECEALAGSLRLTVSPAGSLVLVDGREVGRAPFTDVVYVEPGEHDVQVELAGHASQNVSIVTPGGRETPITIALLPTGSAESPTQSPSTGPSLLGITGLAAGGAAIVTGLVLVLASNNEAGAADERLASILASPNAPAANECGVGSLLAAQCEELADAERASLALRNGAIAAFTVGGALAVGGIVTFIVDTDDSNGDKPLSMNVGPRGLTLSGVW